MMKQETKLLITWIIGLILATYMTITSAEAAPIDSDLANIQHNLKRNTGRLEVISKTVVTPGLGTNIVARPARSSMQERLDLTRNNLTNALTRAEIAERLAERRQTRITNALTNLYAEKADIEAKIADAKYILLRPWLNLKLEAIKAIIDRLDGEE